MYRLSCPCCRQDHTRKSLRVLLAKFDSAMGSVSDVYFGYLCDEWALLSYCIGPDAHRLGKAADIRVDEHKLVDAVSVALSCGAVEVAVKKRKDKWVMHLVSE